MSGGRFDYDQNKLQYLAEDIQEIIERNRPLYPGDRHSPEIIARYQEAAYNLERTYQMVQRIDWLESQDDGPKSFMERWDAEVPPSWEETLKAKQSRERHAQGYAYSKCCDVSAVTAGGKSAGCTCWYVCSHCRQPCDIVFRNNRTQPQ